MAHEIQTWLNRRGVHELCTVTLDLLIVHVTVD